MRQDERWAEWFRRDRQRSGSAASQATMERELAAIRDRVLDRAGLAPGDCVLDADAGTGLLALEARRRVGPSGRVCAVDVSAGALSQNPPDGGGPIGCVAGDVVRLPFAAGTFDAVLTRSVLMYVGDKRATAREFHRVLRPGGRAALFEPINKVSTAHMWRWELDLSPIQADHYRVMARLEATWADREAMMGFDERDLVRCFTDAGFQSVELSHELTYTRGVRQPELLSAWLRNRQTGTQLSYEEAARAVLGDAADEHLRVFDRLIREQPAAVLFANAYLTARRAN